MSTLWCQICNNQENPFGKKPETKDEVICKIDSLETCQYGPPKPGGYPGHHVPTNWVRRPLVEITAHMFLKLPDLIAEDEDLPKERLLDLLQRESGVDLELNCKENAFRVRKRHTSAQFHETAPMLYYPEYGHAVVDKYGVLVTNISPDVRQAIANAVQLKLEKQVCSPEDGWGILKSRGYATAVFRVERIA